jgi:hypothetical protein
MSDLMIYNTSEDSSFSVYALAKTTRLYTDSKDVLRQRVLKALMSKQDTDAFFELSTGLDQLSGTNVARNDLAGEVLARIRATEEVLRQVQVDTEPPESKLESINILGISYESVGSVRVMIEIVNQAGDTISAEVTN